MSDFASSLPVRTENNGDVRVFLSDGTTPSQFASVDTFGSQSSIIRDASGNAVTTQANGGQRALDVRSQSNGPVTPGTVANFSDLIGGQYNTVLPTLTNGQQSAVQVDSNGRILVNTSNNDDHNYGVVGANTLRTAAQIGNATGAANFNFGSVGAQTLRVASQLGNATGAADFSFGAIGAQTLRVAAQLSNATGALDYGTGSATAQTLRVTLSNFPATLDTNYGVVGANTLRTASQIGNSTGAADFNAGATGAQTLRVTSNQGAPNTVANSWPVTLTDGVDAIAVNTDGSINVVIADSTPGTPVNNYNTAASVAAAATSTHDYTVTAGKTLYLNQIEASGSAKMKIEVRIETGVATSVFDTKWVQFNSTADTNMTIHIDNPIAVATGVRVRIIRTNKDNQAQDLYSTISGYELP